MQTIRYKSSGQSVFILEELLYKLGYRGFTINTYFDLKTHEAVLDFQRKNNLVVDGIVGAKTWSVLFEKERELFKFNDKLLSESDLVDFANQFGLELAAVKAVNEIESSGKGFLLDGRPKILFEGHIFWRRLEFYGLNPQSYLEPRLQNVLYKTWTRSHYEGGIKEYFRLEKAAGMSDLPQIHDAAYEAASWGSFQIMGFHWKSLGYSSVDHFVSTLYEHEREHLKAFGKFLEVNNLLRFLKSRDWTRFALGYNGSGQAANKYDERLENAYKRYLRI